MPERVKRPSLHERPLVATIGVTDPLAAAGMLLDLFIAERLEVRPLAVCVGVSAQDGRGAFMLQAIDEAVVVAQLTAITALPIAAVRIGALPSVGAVRAVSDFVRARGGFTVFDPVIATSAGGVLMPEDAREAAVRLLFPHLTLLTPNRAEAEALTGHDVTTIAEMSAAALHIRRLGAPNVLVKGGHVEGELQDLLYDGVELRRFSSSRLPRDMRGTGCALAATIAASLAHGNDLVSSVRTGRRIVRILMQAARGIEDMRVVA